MTSNAFSKRQGFLKNASLCKPPPPPPPPPPGPTRTCEISPSHLVVEVGSGDTVDCSGCAPHLPENEVIETECVAVHGSFGPPDEDAENCGASAAWPYEPPDEPGVDLITCTFTWSDSGQCQATADVTVNEEENGDNDE